MLAEYVRLQLEHLDALKKLNEVTELAIQQAALIGELRQQCNGFATLSAQWAEQAVKWMEAAKQEREAHERTIAMTSFYNPVRMN